MSCDRVILENGMRLVIKEKKGFPLSSLYLFVNAGSKDEPKELSGISHLIEHMVFKGSKKFGPGEVARFIESFGGSLNAFTSFDYTGYYFNLPTEKVAYGLEAMADMICFPTFSEKELLLEKEVVVEEIKRAKDDPQKVLDDRIFSEAFPKHPYGRPVLGFEETVKIISKKDLFSFHTQFYRPDNFVLSFSGGLPKEEVVDLAKRYFDHLPKEEKSSPHKYIESPCKFLGPVDFHIDMDTYETYLGFAFVLPSVGSPDLFALEVGLFALFCGDSSRLSKRLKLDLGIARSFLSVPMFFSQAGILVTHIISEDKDIERVFEEGGKEMLKALKTGLSHEEIEKAKNSIRGNLFYNKETIEVVSRDLGYYETLLSDYRFEERYVKEIEKVNLDDVERVLSKYLKKDRAVFGLISKRKKRDLSSLFFSPKKIHIPLKKSSISDIEVIFIGDSKVILKKRKDVPIFSLRMGFLGGSCLDPKGKYGLCRMVSEILPKSTKSCKSLLISSMLDSLSSYIYGFSGRNMFGLGMDSLSVNFEKSWKIFEEIVSEPGFDEDELKKVKDETLSAMKQQKDNPKALCYLTFLKVLFENHPYGRNPLGTESGISRVDRKDVIDFWKSYGLASNMVVSCVGDFDKDWLIEKVENIIFSLPKGKPNIKKRNPGPIKTRLKEVKSKVKNQTHIMYGFRTPGILDPSHYTLEVINGILEKQSGPLFKALREDKGLCYEVHPILKSGIWAGHFSIYAATSFEKEEKVVDLIVKLIDSIIKARIDLKEIEDAKRYLILNHFRSLQKNSNWSFQLLYNEIFGIGIHRFLKYTDIINSISLDEVVEVAAKFLNPEKAVIIKVRPKCA